MQMVIKIWVDVNLQLKNGLVMSNTRVLTGVTISTRVLTGVTNKGVTGVLLRTRVLLMW